MESTNYVPCPNCSSAETIEMGVRNRRTTFYCPNCDYSWRVTQADQEMLGRADPGAPPEDTP
jgi:transposase-like protein